MRAQADATTKIFARIPGRDAMLARMREIEGSAAGLTQQVVRADNGRLLLHAPQPGRGPVQAWSGATGPDGTDHVIVDPEALSKAAGRHARGAGLARPRGTAARLAYAMQVGGGEIGVLARRGRGQLAARSAAPVDRIRFGSRWPGSTTAAASSTRG
jgi:hypothetical protein